MDMRFWWVRDRTRQGQFKIQWAPGISNHADYFTKHFPPAHHQLKRPIYLHLANHVSLLDCEGVLISLPSRLVTDILDHSSNDVSAHTGMPARSVTDMLVTLHDSLIN